MANDNKKEVTKKKVINFINSKLHLQLNNSNTTYKKLWGKKDHWWLVIDNSKFQMDYHLLLVDTIDKCIHYFEIPANEITNSEDRFAQYQGKSSILLIKDNTLDFEDHYNENHFSFKPFYIKKVLLDKDKLDRINLPNGNNKKSSIPVNKNISASNNLKPAKSQKTTQYKPSKTIRYTKNMINKMVEKAGQYETKIYRNCKNYQKKPIFDRVPETKEIWDNIKTFVKSRDDFGKFIRALYNLIFETTKDEDPNNTFENGRPKPIYSLPKKYIKPNTETKHFMDIVDILRHTLGEAHTPSKLKIPKWKTSYPDALKELLGSRIEPQSPKEFKILQIEILKRFENFMKEVLRMLEDDLNRPQNP